MLTMAPVSRLIVYGPGVADACGVIEYVASRYGPPAATGRPFKVDVPRSVGPRTVEISIDAGIDAVL